MTYSPTVRSESQKLNPSSIIELYKLDLFEKLHGGDYTYYFHAGTNLLTTGSKNIVWAGQTYTAFPIQVEGYEYAGNGQLPQPKLKVANLNFGISTILDAIRQVNPGNDLIGAKVTRIRTFARFLDSINFPNNVNPFGTPDSAAEWPREIYFVIQKSAETRDMCEFTLGSVFDLQGVRAPKRQCLSNLCSWVYRSSECSYTGSRYYTENNVLTTNPALDDCSKTLDGCRARFGEIQTTGVVTQGSNVVTGVDSAVINLISVGDSIWGYGLNGTNSSTVSGINVSARTLTTVAASTSTTTLTLAGGYLQVQGLVVNDGTQIRLSGFTTELPTYGMRVTGPFLPTNEDVYVTSVTTTGDGYYYVNLNISFNRGLVGTLRKTVNNAYLSNTTGIPTWINWSLADYILTLAVGDYIFPGTTLNADTMIYLNTKVAQVSLAQASVVPNKPLGDVGSSKKVIGTISIYAPAVPVSSTYSFQGQNLYTVRTGNILPYGGFPGLASFIV